MQVIKHVYLMAIGFAFSSFALASASDNLRLSLDLSSRVQHKFNVDQTAFIQSIGVDSHKVFTGKKGDWAIFTGQIYLNRIDGLTPHPGFYDDENDWELTYRIFNLNITSLPGHLPNVKFGHIELPFGLEHTIGTNGDFRDYNHGRNLGPKADWGVGFNKQYQSWEYEFTYTTGGGQSLDRGDSSYIKTGRVGTNRDSDMVFGLSVYEAELSGTKRDRVAVDVQYYSGLWGTLLELASGSRGDVDQLDGLLEVNWRSSVENWFVYSQYQYFSEDRGANSDETNTILVLGVKFTPDNSWDLSGNLNQDLNQFSGMKKETRVGLQIRHRF